jgi:tetratricopeptide (TPR) repeat protein
MKKRPSAPPAQELLRQALEHQRAGRAREAEGLYRQVLRRAPRQADALHALGLLAYAAGRRDEALKHLRQAVVSRPKAAVFHTHMGVVCRASGRLDEAVARHRRAIALDPRLAIAHNNLGNALRDKGESEDAEARFREALSLDPAYVEAHHNLGLVLRERGAIEEAEAHFRQALRLNPAYGDAYNELGGLLRKRADYEAAADCFRACVTHKPGFAPAYVNLATALQTLGKFEEAPHLFRRALELDPKLSEAYVGLSSVALQEGNVAEAAACSRKAIALKPDLAGAYLTLAYHGKDKDGLREDELRTLEALAERPDLAEEHRSDCYFALAKIYEEAGDHERAFAFARKANEIEHRRTAYSPENNADFIRRSIATFGPAFFAERRGWGSPSERPVFILGLPRSGTTLIEQIVASHPRAFGAGELVAMLEMVEDLPALAGGEADYPECVTALDREAAGRLAERYLGALAAEDTKAARVTDKLPFNFRHLGLIALLFPKARVVHCRRDPRDVAVSCYFLKFLKPISFAYSLTDFGRYYRQYEWLMDHWRAVLPLPLLELQYEELVADPEAKTRELVSFCGLAWDDRCLEFHRTQRPVRTASATQVRQPVYAGSVGRWRRYERFLAPLFEALERERPEQSPRVEYAPKSPTADLRETSA